MSLAHSFSAACNSSTIALLLIWASSSLFHLVGFGLQVGGDLNQLALSGSGHLARYSPRQFGACTHYFDRIVHAPLLERQAVNQASYKTPIISVLDDLPAWPSQPSLASPFLALAYE
jgi:hypothetical protein